MMANAATSRQVLVRNILRLDGIPDGSFISSVIRSNVI
jgi:hypothetical protein